MSNCLWTFPIHGQRQNQQKLNEEMGGRAPETARASGRMPSPEEAYIKR